MAGMRDVIVHAYFEVDLEIVWNALTKLELLETAVRRLREK